VGSVGAVGYSPILPKDIFPTLATFISHEVASDAN